MIESARDADSLALTTRQADTSLTDNGRHAVWQPANEGAQLRGVGSPPECLVINRILVEPESDIRSNGVVDEINVLRNVSDALLPSSHIVPHVMPVHQH